jgi:hypothetical protein
MRYAARQYRIKCRHLKGLCRALRHLRVGLPRGRPKDSKHSQYQRFKARSAGITLLQANGEGAVPLGMARRIRRLEADRAALQARVAELIGMP